MNDLVVFNAEDRRGKAATISSISTTLRDTIKIKNTVFPFRVGTMINENGKARPVSDTFQVKPDG